jgi:hypothetical protein
LINIIELLAADEDERATGGVLRVNFLLQGFLWVPLLMGATPANRLEF